MGLGPSIAIFVGTSVVVVLAAIALAYSSDILADRIGWGSLWVGSVLVAGVTSLPEMVTGATAAHIGAPALAAGDVLGANMMNMSNLAWLVALIGGGAAYNKIGKQQVQGALLALVLTGVVTLFVVLHWHTKWWIVSPASLVILGVYVVGSRILFKSSQAHQQEAEPSGVESSQTTRWAWTVFLISALVILISTPLLATAAHDIATATGIADSFFGVLAVAFITTMPEVTASATALRLNSPDLAFGNMYGSCAFNVMALGIADFFYSKGSLFGALDRSHVLAGIFALVLMSMGIGMLFTRGQNWRIPITRLVAPVFLAVYVVGLYLVYQAGAQS